VRTLLILAILTCPASAQTVWSTTGPGLHTVSTCEANGEKWEELGATCHSDPTFRAAPQESRNLTTMTSAMVASLHYRNYTFEPKDDITAPELSKAIVAILPALVCHNVLGKGCDPTEKIEALPPEARRHFVLHDAQ
jgi:hypothetical protein